MATPPHGQDYGYGRGDSAAQASEPRRHNGTRSHARPDGTGEGPRTARQASPRHSSQATGSYEGNGRYRATAAAGDRAATRVTGARRARTRPAATRATGTAETAIAPRTTHGTITGG